VRPLNIVKHALAATWPAMVQLSPRAECPYGSHVPVLMICCTVFRPKRVLELGTGHFSTSLFLDRDVCPSVERLHSVENDRGWFDQVRQAYSADDKWEPDMWTGPIHEQIRHLDLLNYDLIFVDDSQDQESRSRSIQAVFAGKPRCPVVIHDAECWRYRRHVWAHQPYVIFNAFTPQTAVCLPSHGPQRRTVLKAKIAAGFRAAEGRRASSLDDWKSLGRAITASIIPERV
jgi:hypothetical protein